MEFLKEILCNDKNLVIIAVVIIAVYSLYLMGPQAENIVTASISGLFGIAVGRATAGSSNSGVANLPKP